MNHFSNKIINWRQGKQWFDQGVHNFKTLKNYWYIVCLVFALLLMLVTQLAPSALPLLVVFLSPIMTAFMMGLCQQLAAKQPNNTGATLNAIQVKLGDFLVLGIISALLSLLFQQLHLQLLNILGLPVELTEAMIQNMTGKEAFVRAVLNLLANLPVAMALAFSPALMLFKNLKPFAAVKLSFIGVLKGWKGFFVLMLLFMLVLMAVVVLASLVLTIVMAFMGTASGTLVNVIAFFFVLTVAGIGICAQYQAYRDIYQTETLDEGTDGTEIYTEI